MSPEPSKFKIGDIVRRVAPEKNKSVTAWRVERVSLYGEGWFYSGSIVTVGATLGAQAQGFQHELEPVVL